MRKEAPSVHHLLFTNDSFIFTRSTLHAFVQVKNLLKIYELASGKRLISKKVVWPLVEI